MNSSKQTTAIYLFIFSTILFVSMTSSISTENDNLTPRISPIDKAEYDRIASDFGMRIHPVLKIKKFHTGIDFAAKTGTKVIASADGMVSSAEFKKETYGNVITINHDKGFETLYAQLDEYLVKKGDFVKLGDVIGYVGSSGMASEPHLHYEVRKDGKIVNPKEYIKD